MARIALSVPQIAFRMVSRTASTKAEMRSWIMGLSIGTVVPVGAGGAGPFGSGARWVVLGPGRVGVTLGPCGGDACGRVPASFLVGVV